MPARTPSPRVGGGFGGFTRNPSFQVDLPPIGDYDAPTIPQPSLTVYPGGGRQPGISRAAPTSVPSFNTRLDAGGDVAGSADVSRPTMIASRGGRPPGITSDPNADWQGADRPSITVDPGIDTTARSVATYQAGGTDIANFGGNMTLGQFLNTPLTTMLYGTGRWQQPGSADVHYAGTSRHTPAEVGAADLARPSSEAEARGAEETARLKASGQLNPDATTGTISASANPTGGLMTPAQYEQATFGGLTPTGYRDTTGSATFDSHAGNLMLMASQAFGGPPNNMGTTSDAGHTIFAPGGDFIGHAEEGVVTPERSAIVPGLKQYVSPSQAESWRLGLSYNDPAHIKAKNDWIMAHNPGVSEYNAALTAAYLAGHPDVGRLPAGANKKSNGITKNAYSG